MKHFSSRRFWQCFDTLPVDIQELARRNYASLKKNQAHPSLQLKPVCSGRFRSVRVGLHYRALGVAVPDGVQWFWIGSHADYDQIIGS
ncbi:conserved hypothetical protein [Candidatus Accumulibacter aalborgensis]|uniref:ParE-like toxin domain-containing protein n=1 Tax=Candidatus Accumulibacter aalborgensis TaxID=1860102 RepID=A0A1A8XI73_9PROT|nr:hypothetical protein [Candidatus Accumulibacter aalborgensis]SBT04396.1 conserved hypothetical protein [Candidatus Accumulibacter aalborgensis]